MSFFHLDIQTKIKLFGEKEKVGRKERTKVHFYSFSRGERNFHVFYYMYDGLAADNRLAEFHLDSSLREHHRYLTDRSHNSPNYVDKFQQLKVGFKVLGFRDSEVDTVYGVLAAILHLGDIEFAEVASEDNTDNKSRVIDTAPLDRGKVSFFE